MIKVKYRVFSENISDQKSLLPSPLITLYLHQLKARMEFEDELHIINEDGIYIFKSGLLDFHQKLNLPESAPKFPIIHPSDQATENFIIGNELEFLKLHGAIKHSGQEPPDKEIFDRYELSLHGTDITLLAKTGKPLKISVERAGKKLQETVYEDYETALLYKPELFTVGRFRILKNCLKKIYQSLFGIQSDGNNTPNIIIK